MRAEIARLRESLARADALLTRVEAERVPAASPSPPAASVQAVAPAEPPPAPPTQRAPALNTPPRLPASEPENYKKIPPRIDVLLQSRYDHFADRSRNNTFFLRKAEVGFKANVAKNVDFSLELDAVRAFTANDPYRRTYIRFSHLKRLHFKVGMEKAPIGLEELTSSGQIPFVDRSEVSDRFAAAEEIGVFAESAWDKFLFQASLTNGGRRLLRDDNRQKDFTARAVWAPVANFSLGAATLQGHVGADATPRTRYALESRLGSTNLQGAQAEFFRAKDGGVWSTAFYVNGFYARPLKSGPLTHVQPVARFEYMDREDDDAAREFKLLTVGFSLMMKEHKSKLQFNWLRDVRSNSPRKDEVRAQYSVEF